MEQLREKALIMQQEIGSISAYVNSIIFRCDEIIEEPKGLDEENRRLIREYTEQVRKKINSLNF